MAIHRLMGILGGVVVATVALPAVTRSESQEPPGSPERPEKRETRRAILLRELRSRLDRVRATAPDAHIVDGGDLVVEPLLGASQAELLTALGEPSRCAGLGGRIAPCQEDSQWFYSFYHLPSGSRGGGPELLLTFSAGGLCTDASWRYTR
jgi:hypothetical protein